MAHFSALGPGAYGDPLHPEESRSEFEGHGGVAAPTPDVQYARAPSAGIWETNSNYLAGQVILSPVTGVLTVCKISHKSTTYAADLAAGKWQEGGTGGGGTGGTGGGVATVGKKVEINGISGFFPGGQGGVLFVNFDAPGVNWTVEPVGDAPILDVTLAGEVIRYPEANKLYLVRVGLMLWAEEADNNSLIQTEYYGAQASLRTLEAFSYSQLVTSLQFLDYMTEADFADVWQGVQIGVTPQMTVTNGMFAGPTAFNLNIVIEEVVLDGMGGAGGGTTTTASGFTLETIVAGPIAVATHLVKPGLRVPQTATVTTLTVELEEAPVGADMILGFERWSAGVSISDLGTVTIPAGQKTGFLTGLTAHVERNDVIRVRCEQVGSTTAGSDALLSVDAI
jgi:hypothetical protein